jgi:monovalent cation:H+ antiporter-2, CPA2 family
MAQHLELIFTLTGGLAAAVVFGLATQRLRLSPIVGYLIAGIAVGPFTPGFVAHAEIAEQLAEVGVILLMFGVGLHFRVDELLAVRAIALPGALLQIAATTAAGALVGRWLGWSVAAGLVFGLAVAVASTVVLLRVLIDHDALRTRPGHVAVGWLLVEDMFTVLVLVLLPITAAGVPAGGPAKFFLSVGGSLLKIAALVGFTWFVGKRTVPRVLAYVARTGSRELFTLTVLVLALGIAVGSAQLFGASMALGAFLAGLVIGQSEFSSRAAEEALPMRDAFAVLFFVSMGMLLDPGQILPNAKLIAATLALILVVKPLTTLVVALALRSGIETAVTVAVALAQIGEFSFILAGLGRRLGVLPEQATQTLVAASILSITCNPLLFRQVPAVVRRLRRPGHAAVAAGAPLRSGRSTP